MPDSTAPKIAGVRLSKKLTVAAGGVGLTAALAAWDAAELPVKIGILAVAAVYIATQSLVDAAAAWTTDDADLGRALRINQRLTRERDEAVARAIAAEELAEARRAWIAAKMPDAYPPPAPAHEGPP